VPKTESKKDRGRLHAPDKWLAKIAAAVQGERILSGLRAVLAATLAGLV
jgi:hypothetical protein